MHNSALRLLTVAALVLLTTSACRSVRGARSPEALRDAYAQALKRDDPDAAYALLSPELQARTPRAEFRTRWKTQAGERAAAQTALVNLPKAQHAAISGGQTVHGDRILTWAEVAGDYQMVAGLPGLPDSSTPSQTIRALLVAIRGADLRGLEALVSDELAARQRDDWGRRTALIEALLEQPGAIEYSSDMQRAVLRYESGRALTLEQSPAGWRLTALQ